MKSYLQGMITGGVLVFASIVFMGARGGNNGKYQVAISGEDIIILDTSNGIGFRRFEYGNDLAHEKFTYESFNAYFLKQLDEARKKGY